MAGRISSIGDSLTGKFYITTPLYYVNDKPHIGHAFATIVADVIARWHRLKGEKVWFLTGTDEHGSKIEKAATEAKMEPKEFADGIVRNFINTWKALDISYDDFIRTTEKRHTDVVVKVIEDIFKKGDIYKGEYEGWYCVPDETFFTDLQLKDGKCPVCGRAVTKVKEDTYFFKLGKYQDALLEYYNKHPDFLGRRYKNEIINRVKNGLNDLSITRTTVRWAVPFPFEKGHYLYVWVDALINYVSALGWPDGGKFREFWPADVHFVGKEINWFHSVIWPAMLLSAGIELPKRVYASGWWTVNGQKMGKSMGNAIDPNVLAKKYTADAFRFFLIREKPLDDDGDFSEKALVERLNNELAADLGNLVSRTLALAEKFDGKIEGKAVLEGNLRLDAIDHAMEKIDPYLALNEIWAFIKSVNKYINDTKPWELQGKKLGEVLYNLLEAVRIIGILVSPFVPESSRKIAKQLGVKEGNLSDCRFGKFSGKPKKGEHIFKKIDYKEGE